MEQNRVNGYCGYITTIKQLRKHSNADRLQCATVFGNNVIVDLSYMEGQRIIYFPVDGQLSEEFACDNNLVRLKDENGNNVGGYLDPDKRNITALKLRGEKSDGLVLPIEVLSKYVDVKTLSDGDQIAMLDGHEICRKYIPRSNQRRGRSDFTGNKNRKEEKGKVFYPFFVEHIDTAQLAYNQNAFREGDTCYITLKMHGTSARTANAVEIVKEKRNYILKKIFNIRDKEVKRFAVVSGTRRTTLRNYDGGYYGSNAFRQKYQDFFKDKLPKGVEVFYEIVGYTEGNRTIMGRCSNKLVKDKEFEKQYGKETVFSYGCEPGENDIYVYRMTMTNEDGFVVELPWEQVQIECEKLGVKCVPTFEKFVFTTWDDLMERVEKYYDGTDPIGKTHVREGVVVRIDNRESFTAYKHKNFSFKVLEGIIKDKADAPDMEEAEELVVESV
ncbi:2'-5' RNA ligase [Acetatifactor muris]|uniref:RNA ligase family protein n=1 Tax=Acetatifactor muris TaxID=879566 RepID=UPI001FA83161|nr:RNA ligase family protein [Acetatifactor muris]MCR2051067.1 2'-5' RNA ligase [Acetatifactor muris]